MAKLKSKTTRDPYHNQSKQSTMATTNQARRPQETAQSNAPFHQGDDDPSSSDDDIPAEPSSNYKRNRTIQFTTPTLRPTKRLRNSREYIPPSKRRKTPADQEQAIVEEEEEDENTLLNNQLFEVVNSFRGTKTGDHTLAPTEPQPEPQPLAAAPVKRGRGRPRKHPLPVVVQHQTASEKQLSERALDEIEALAEETLDPVEPTQERDEMLESVEVEYHTAYEAVKPAEDQDSPLLRDVDDVVGDEKQQDDNGEQEEDAEEQDGGAEQEEDAEQEEGVEEEEDAEPEPDSESDEELPSLFDPKKRIKKQKPPAVRPELRPEHTRPSPVLGSDFADDFANGDEYPNQEDDYEEGEGNNQPPRAPSNLRSSSPEELLLFQLRGVDDSYQVEIPNDTIRPLRSIMGTPGWTNLGKDWIRIISQPYQDQIRKSITTQVVKDFCEDLRDIKLLYDQCPRGVSLTAQNTYLRGVQEWMKESISAAQYIMGTCAQHLTPNGVIEPRYRHALRQDLFLHGFPMLISVLLSAYCLGHANDEDPFGLPRSNTFTRSRVRYLDLFTGWIEHVGEKLVSEVSDDEDADEDAEDQPLGSVNRFQTGVLKRKMRENRQNFIKYLVRWRGTVREALSHIDDATGQQARKRARDEAIKRALQDAEKAELARKAVRDQAIRKERQAAEEAERAKKKAQYEAFALSTQRLGSQLRSGVQRTQSVARPTPTPRSSGIVASIEAIPARHHQQQQPPHNPYKLWYPKWSDEKRRWLLKELMEVGPRVTDVDYEDWADCLSKPIEQVRHEVKIHRAAALSLAEAKGRSAPWWAKGVDG